MRKQEIKMRIQNSLNKLINRINVLKKSQLIFQLVISTLSLSFYSWQ